MKRALRLLAFLAAFAPGAFAHELRPGYLELRQTALETYETLWKVPGLGGNLRLGLYVELPTNCTNVTEPRGSMVNNAYSERWTIKCAAGLSGGTIHVAGLSAAMTDVLVRVERNDGTTQVVKLLPSAPSFTVEASPHPFEVARTYLVLGIEHILGGVDHLLFVLALLLIVKGLRRVVATITAFTIAHSITLALATLGLLRLPGPPVEATIALSIVFVAAEIIRGSQGKPGMTARWPWAIAFTFGLLHGLGFAGALSEIGVPQNAITVALLFFNIGVEIGQLLFVGAFYILALLVSRISIVWPRWVKMGPAYGIGTIATFWVLQRLGMFGIQ